MVVARRWTGHEAAALRQAQRKSIRAYAEHLGVSVATVANWNNRGEQARLRTDTQQLLDIDLARAPDDVQQRFEAILASGPPDVMVEHISASAVWSTQEIEVTLLHLREQWHALVRADNLLGPRHALAGVHSQLAVMTELMAASAGEVRREVVGLAAQYAESAAWLHEDAGDRAKAEWWTTQAMQWAHEVGDLRMVAWTAYRRSQQVAATRSAAWVIDLARVARRDEDVLPAPMRAAIRVQEAHGRAMGGEGRTALRLLDEAHAWAAEDSAGEARGGHGSFCTPNYIEIQRARCLTLLYRPHAAVECYERALPGLPSVYRRDRAAALVGQAAAFAAAGAPDRAAAAAHAALPVARAAGSQRVVVQIATVGAQLTEHRRLSEVAGLLDDLAEAG